MKCFTKIGFSIFYRLLPIMSLKIPLKFYYINFQDRTSLRTSNKISIYLVKFFAQWKVIKFYKQCQTSHQMRLSFNKRQFYIHYELSHKSSLFIVSHILMTLGISSSISAYNEMRFCLLCVKIFNIFHHFASCVFIALRYVSYKFTILCIHIMSYFHIYSFLLLM
jgi:hypothetical protein